MHAGGSKWPNRSLSGVTPPVLGLGGWLGGLVIASRCRRHGHRKFVIKFHCLSVSRSKAGGSKKAPPANQQKRGSPCGQSP